MKRRLVGLGNLMAFIAVLAIDLAAARAFVGRDEYFGWNMLCLEAVAPIVLSLQVAVFCMLNTLGRNRIFWIGFLTFGILATISINSYFADPPFTTTSLSGSGISIQEYPGGPMARLWVPYLEIVYHQGLERLGYTEFGRTDWLSSSVNAVVFFVPQLLLALTGGLLARLISGRWSRAPSAQVRVSPGQDAPHGACATAHHPYTESGSLHLRSSRMMVGLIVAVVAASVILLAVANMSTWPRMPAADLEHGKRDPLELSPMIDNLQFFPPPKPAN